MMDVGGDGLLGSNLGLAFPLPLSFLLRGFPKKSGLVSSMQCLTIFMSAFFLSAKTKGNLKLIFELVLWGECSGLHGRSESSAAASSAPSREFAEPELRSIARLDIGTFRSFGSREAEALLIVESWLFSSTGVRVSAGRLSRSLSICASFATLFAVAKSKAWTTDSSTEVRFCFSSEVCGVCGGATWFRDNRSERMRV
jgi:hypothetical protein